MTTPRQVVYVSPAAEIFTQLAREACRVLTEQGQTGFDDPAVMRGFADYLALCAELTAKYLNKGHYELLDSPKA